MSRPFWKYTVALALGGAMVGPVACTDLSENPFTEITEANFNPTEADLAALMAPAYTPLRPMWMSWHGALDSLEETADVLVTPVRPNGWYDGGTYIRLHEHRWDPNQSQFNGRWGNAYSGINAANRVIYQLESGLIPIEGDVLRATLAELRGIRAYYYYFLLDVFGNVPIVTDFTDTELPHQSTRQQVYDFVVSELNEILPDLSEEAGAAMYGRINRWAAEALLARVYLNAEVYTGTPRWEQVLDVTQRIISAGAYQLDASYRSPFSRDNDASRENIFAVPYDAIFAAQSNFHMKTLKPELRWVFNLNAGPWGGSASQPQFIETYDADDGRLGDTWLVGPQFDNQGRGYEFVQHIPAISDSEITERIEFYHGYPVWKYEIYAGMTGASDVDYPVIRYAEVLMMRAEALLRTGDAGGAAGLVTQVRQRAFAGSDPSKATVTAGELMQGSSFNYGWYDTDGVVKTGPGGSPVVDGGADIQFGRMLDELGWEFAVEGNRRQHLIRFGVYTTKTWFNHVPNGDHRALMPIPQARINANPNLVQNTGY